MYPNLNNNQEQDNQQELETPDDNSLDSSNREETSSNKEEDQLDELTGLPQDVIDAIITCYKFYDNEDKPIREVMQIFWKKLENYFHGIQRLFLDATARDWRRVDVEDLDEEEFDPTFYDKIINIYRAHGESVISALSIKVPNVVFYPDDADVVEDVDTAKACTKIDKLIDKHNNSLLIWIHSLYILYNCGVTAAYIYNHKSSKYGTVDLPIYGDDIHITTVNLHCSACNSLVDSIEFKGQFDPTTLPQFVDCPNCGNTLPPKVETTQEILPVIIDYEQESKSRVVIDVFSPLYAHFPFYARKQEYIPYLQLKFEQHYASLKARYPRMNELGLLPKGSGSNSVERDLRSFNYWQNNDNKNLVSTTCQWLRPWAFEILEDNDLIKKCKKFFPDGCYAVILQDKVAEAYNEDLDDHWEITNHPLSNYLHADPIGKPIAPIQELRTEAIDLAVETFQHSIPETFVDGTVLNFAKYSAERARPGMKYPVKKPADGASISESFYSDKSASLTEEHEAFIKRLDVDGQFVIGDFPSVYGGPAMSGSKTAKEYVESQARALQRLNLSWIVLKGWWARIKGKAVPLYINSMVSDEKFVERSKESETGFINVWIREAELNGKLGSVEADTEEELPTSSVQLKQMFMELIGLNNDIINQGLFHPQNLPLMTKAMGAPEFYLPGSDQRDKQFSEISELLKGPQGYTIEPEEYIDEDGIHVETIQAFLVSSTGLAAKRFNINGYNNCVIHLNMHMMKIQQKAMQEQQEQLAKQPVQNTENSDNGESNAG